MIMTTPILPAPPTDRAAAVRRARRAAESVTDPELPMLSLLDLGVLRAVEIDGDQVRVTITPTYSGCPAMATMRDDLVRGLRQVGFGGATVAIRLDPPWTSDWITERGRAALREAGISAPAPASKPAGPIPLRLGPTRRTLTCPHCGSADVEVVSEFGSTACRAQYRCRACAEPFDHFKEL